MTGSYSLPWTRVDASSQVEFIDGGITRTVPMGTLCHALQGTPADVLETLGKMAKRGLLQQVGLRTYVLIAERAALFAEYRLNLGDDQQFFVRSELY